MKNLLFLLLFLLLSGCKYGSQKEAMSTCRSEYERKEDYKEYFRQCKNEPSSRTVLGLYWKSQFSGSFVGKRFPY